MGKRNRRPKRKGPATAGPEDGGGPGGLGALLAGAGLEASASSDEAPPEAADTPDDAVPDDLWAGLGKVVLRKERKGHGGKTVTRVEKLPGSDEVLQARAKALGKALGCGTRLDGGDVLVQGDQRDRLADWLAEQGVRRVVTG